MSHTFLFLSNSDHFQKISQAGKMHKDLKLNISLFSDGHNPIGGRGGAFKHFSDIKSVMGSSKYICIYVHIHRYRLQRKERNKKWLLDQCTSKTGLNWNVLLATEHHHTMKSGPSSCTRL